MRSSLTVPLALALWLGSTAPALATPLQEETTAAAPRARLARGLLASLGLGLLAPAALTAGGAALHWATAGRDGPDLLVGGFVGFQLGVAVAWLVAPWVVDHALGHGRPALAGALAGLGAGLLGAVAVYSLALLVGASAPLLAVAGAVALVGPSLGVAVALAWAAPAPGAPPALALRF